jgi:hypothetical protein
LKLKRKVSNGIKIWEHLLIVEDGIETASTQLEDLRCVSSLSDFSSTN